MLLKSPSWWTLPMTRKQFDAEAAKQLERMTHTPLFPGKVKAPVSYAAPHSSVQD